MKLPAQFTFAVCLLAALISHLPAAADTLANTVIEVTLTSEKTYPNPFTDLSVDAVVTAPDGARLKIPAFWAGGNQWRFRYASGSIGAHTYRTECSDVTNPRLHGVQGKIEVVPYTGDNPLIRHGPIRIAKDRRHFEHADGTPFFWLADTWWKGLCKRLTWPGFQELTADRRAKGFSVVQIVCGPYPDEGLFEPRWENEGGKPYDARDFGMANPAYFDFADRRIKHLVAAGIVPAIVGGWGRGGSLEAVGVAGYKRHWRNLIARYGAYPVVWIIGGEAGGPQWTELAKYVRQTDPYHRPITMHPFDSARKAVTDETAVDFDMLQTGHGDWNAAVGAIPKLNAAYARKPAMPVLVGEACYEGHMQSAFQDVERYLFWACMLSGAAGHTYGAAGVWHAGVEGDPGITPVYDLTTWKEGMSFPGSTQIGLGKKLLEQYPWSRFEPHPEWAEAGSFAAGIPGEVRFIYQPRRNVYDWNGPVVKQIERDVPYHAFYVNPTDGKKYDLETFVRSGPLPRAFGEIGANNHSPLLFEDRFDGGNTTAWRDYGSTSHRENGKLIGSKQMVTVVEKVRETDVMAGADANSDAEAGIILRFHDRENYIVALYSPLFKTIFIHDRRNGQWGANLGEVPVPEIGPKIQITAAASGDYAAMSLTDGMRTYNAPVVKVSNTTAGKAGVWLFQIGNRQEFGNFRISKAHFDPPKLPTRRTIWNEEYKAPALPSPQDWVLVMEPVKRVDQGAGGEIGRD